MKINNRLISTEIVFNRQMKRMRKKTKILAMYLPQYHEIPENNEWWGEGFTEWTNLKKAVPLYNGHYQPRIPLDNNYYNLLDTKIINTQMNMAKEYGVDGFCVYHYWFHGKQLLEKPFEMLLKSGEIGLPFCFCWANEPWTRTWDGDKGSKEILIDQDYGVEDDWESHFNYLLNFFRNEMYIKVCNKPVFVIYKEKDIVNADRMLDMWENLAKKAGFDGIYIINTRRSSADSFSPNYGNAYFDFEPFVTLNNTVFDENEHVIKSVKKYNGGSVLVYDYEKFCARMVKRYCGRDGKHFLGAFIGFDNSPRRGENTRWIFGNNTPDIFEKFFAIQYERSCNMNNEFMFINAWNEWTEGTYLEPDELYKFGYLEAIKRCVDGFEN